MKLLIALAVLLGCAAAAGQLQAAEPADQVCVESEKYLELADQAEADFRMEDAVQFLKHATTNCPTWQSWQRLGEVASTLGEDDTNTLAAQAFKKAYEDYAETDQERAQTSTAYAQLLLIADRNPKGAETWAFNALRLDPENPEVRALAAKVEEAAASPTQDDITRGFFSDLTEKGPVIRHSLTEEDFTLPADTGGAGGGDAEPASIAPLKTEYALNFQYATDDLYPESRQLIETIAGAFESDPKFASRTFLFVGHTDVRGPRDHNAALSVSRAQKVRDLIVSIAPTLSDRINVSGRGEEEPRDPANSEEAHRRNRRVVIWVM